MKKTLYGLLLCLPAMLCACSSHNEELIGTWESQEPARLAREEGVSQHLGFLFNPDGTFGQHIILKADGMPLGVALVSGKWEYIRGSRLREDFTALVRLDYDVSTLRVEAMSPAFRPYDSNLWTLELASQFLRNNEIQDTPRHNQPVYALHVTRLGPDLLMIGTPQGNVRLQRH